MSAEAVAEVEDRSKYAGVLRFYDLAKHQEWAVRDVPWDDLPPVPEGKGSPERQATLRRFQDMVNGDIGLIPLFSEFENVVTRENVQGYVSYPDGIPVLAKLSLG